MKLNGKVVHNTITQKSEIRLIHEKERNHIIENTFSIEFRMDSPIKLQRHLNKKLQDKVDNEKRNQEI